MTRMWQGTGVVEGLVHAPTVRMRAGVPAPEDLGPIPPEQRGEELERLRDAARQVADRLAARADAATGEAAEVLAATSALATDKGWLKAAGKHIATGVPAPWAAHRATDQFVAMFEKLGGRMAERVTDLRDIRDRIVAQLTGQLEPGIPSPEQPSILLADDLAPADTVSLDPARIVAVVTRLGGPTSHTAIIARQLGIPCIVAVTDLDEVPDGPPLLLDGAAGILRADVAPDEAAALVQQDRARRDAVAAWSGPGRTADGHPVSLLANVADGDAAARAASGHAEGVGLFRTELAFLSAASEPTVEQQTEIYRRVFDAFAGRKVVVRTLDAGSDKPVAFATLPDEANPALGVRGNRIGAAHPEMVEHQLDAIRAAVDSPGEAWVMAPMIATVDEARDFAARVRGRGMKAGVMVEVPAVALLAERFVAEVDFLSIGTNDLSQYTMAADRLSPDLAHLTDAWQPAVLTLVGRTTEAGAAAGVPVGVCGEAAADPLLACVLVGLGITSLSMAAPAIPAVGAQLASVTLDQCRRAARAALACGSVADVRRGVTGILRED